jgi:hypothetical protein
VSKEHLASAERDTDHDNGECGVSLDVTTVGREFELDGRHIVDARNITHWRRVARATLNLLAIRESLADAETDEVVATVRLAPKTFCERPRSSLRADEGVCFTGRLTFTIDVLNDGRVQS